MNGPVSTAVRAGAGPAGRDAAATQPRIPVQRTVEPLAASGEARVFTVQPGPVVPRLLLHRGITGPVPGTWDVHVVPPDGRAPANSRRRGIDRAVRELAAWEFEGDGSSICEMHGPVRAAQSRTYSPFVCVRSRTGDELAVQPSRLGELARIRAGAGPLELVTGVCLWSRCSAVGISENGERQPLFQPEPVLPRTAVAALDMAAELTVYEEESAYRLGRMAQAVATAAHRPVGWTAQVPRVDDQLLLLPWVQAGLMDPAQWEEACEAINERAVRVRQLLHRHATVVAGHDPDVLAFLEEPVRARVARGDVPAADEVVAALAAADPLWRRVVRNRGGGWDYTTLVRTVWAVALVRPRLQGRHCIQVENHRERKSLANADRLAATLGIGPTHPAQAALYPYPWVLTAGHPGRPDLHARDLGPHADYEGRRVRITDVVLGSRQPVQPRLRHGAPA